MSRAVDPHRRSRALATAVVLVSALAGAGRATAETSARKAPLTIPDLPHDGSRFGVVIIGEPDASAIAARGVVRRALVDAGHPVEMVRGLEAAPRREDVLRICAEYELDGVAFVSVRRGGAPARADVDLRDANGDPFRGEVVQDQEGWSLRMPILTKSSATFLVPTLVEPPSATEPRPVPLGPLPPLLWFDEGDGSARLGERVMADGEAYRLFGRPDLEVRYQSRKRTKHALMVTGIATAAMSLVVVPVVWSLPGSRLPPPDTSSAFFWFDGALLAAAVGVVIGAASIDPDPWDRRSLLLRARDFNAVRLPDDGDSDGDPEP